MRNDKLLDALRLKNQGRPPVWLMRQAGRYMPEYRALRQKYSFIEMCHQPELIATITQLPIQVFNFDAAILFSDILVIPEALGVGLYFEDQVGPIIERPIQTLQDIQNLPRPIIAESLHYVFEGIKLLKKTLEVPLIGFCGAPFTVASYMIEGGTSRHFKKTKQWMLRDEEGFHLLLNKIAEATIDYLNLQIDCGVEVIQVFDSWAHCLGHHQFQKFSLTYLDKILKGIKNQNIPVILYCRGSSVFLRELASIKPAGISLDWNIEMASARQLLSSLVALQGNLDPDILYAPVDVLKKEVQRLLSGMKGDSGYIFNLGHGIHPDVSCDSVKVLVETIHGQES